MTLIEAIKKNNFAKEIDFLQIDCEGYDDQVIYASDLERTKPVAINYEFCHLSNKRYDKLAYYLDSLGYYRFKWSLRDECAIKTNS